MNTATNAARADLRIATAYTSAKWTALLVASGLTPTEANVFASGGMVQAIFATTIPNAEEQARSVADLMTRGGLSSIVVLEPSEDDAVWMVSGKVARAA